jgi:membrane-bound metal-dependent hydrolase YbcI (DUF457 family)
MSLAYLLGKGSGKLIGVKPNVALLMVVSILPDIDIVFDFLTGSQIHRGPTHSIIVAFLAFIPLFIIYRKKAIPYFLALISHPLIGDFFIGGQLQLFWPLSITEFGLHELGSLFINIFSPINITLELILFVFAMLILYKSKDWKTFFKADITNLILIIPVATVFLPSTIGYPFTESLLLSEPLLALAHLVYLALFAIAILKSLSLLCKRLAKHDSRQFQTNLKTPKQQMNKKQRRLPNNIYPIHYFQNKSIKTK